MENNCTPISWDTAENDLPNITMSIVFNGQICRHGFIFRHACILQSLHRYAIYSESSYFLHDEMLKPTEALDPMNNKCTISSLYWHLGPLLGDGPKKFSTLSGRPGKLLTGYITCLTTTGFPFLSQGRFLNSYGSSVQLRRY